MPMSTPAAAASAEPRAKVIAMMRSVGIAHQLRRVEVEGHRAHRLAGPRLHDEARSRKTISRNDTAKTVSCSVVSRTPPDDEARARGASDGKNFGSGAEDELAAVLEEAATRRSR